MTPLNDGILSVMMPIYNEEKTLAVILGHVLSRSEVGEVIKTFSKVAEYWL